MGIFDKLFGKKPVAKDTQNTDAKAGGSAPPTAMSDQWRRFFSIVPMHVSAESAMMGFVGNWPKGLDPDVFSSLDLSDFLRRIREYQTMTYPLRSPFFTPDDSSRPTYQMVDGKVGRASTFIDMIFLEVVPPNVKKQFKPNESVEPGQVVWKLILHYAEFRLARLIFLLPFMHSASEAAKKGDKAVIMVIEETLIQIYKGVENLLFDVYSDLPEGSVLGDAEVTKKLRSFLAA